MEKINILFVHFGDQWIRGSERVLIDLMGNIDKDQFGIFLWTNVVPLASIAQQRGITTRLTNFELYFDYGSPKLDISKYFLFIREGIDIIRTEDISIVHSNSAAPAQWLVPAVWWTRRPLVVHIHTPYLRRSRVICLLHQCDRIVGVSAPVLVGPIEDGIASHKLRIIPNGIDFSRFSGVKTGRVKAELGLLPGDFLLVGVGSLINRKGWDIALQALHLLDHDVHLCIAGDGPLKARLADIAADLRITNRVHFLGNLDQPSVVYEAADVVIIPSRVEAFGLVAVEAGYFGNAVIASDVGGLSAVIQHGISGLLIPPDDPGLLAKSVLLLKNDSAKRRVLGSNAKQSAEGRFRAAHMAENFENEYKVLDGRSRNRIMRIIAAARSYLYLLRRMF
ncbi:glycosyltransferase family 4 protein [Acidiphilium acidophilum]|uniref:glycosyltransferase family 4 protein n=1 Tax=Acidiphilium acidophilum TaxID=76588 RepID=UPI002E8E7227|nr:glycosyltransferase family 4 protein [Acidiphilium acidophilum]